MTLKNMALTVVFDLDGTLVDTAPDLIDTLNIVFAREGLPPVDQTMARNMIGGGARRKIESGLKAQGHPIPSGTVDRMFVDFISYPYEWSFSQLKDAALTTLAAHELALDHGMTLKDASAYNVQFVDGKPVLIDSLSFERAVPDEPWVAYRQFCQHFLAPLALMA